MPILDKIKSIFQASAPYCDTRRKSKVLQYLRRDVDPESTWEVVSVLGDGSFGKVYKVWAFLLTECISVCDVDKLQYRLFLCVFYFGFICWLTDGMHLSLYWNRFSTNIRVIYKLSQLLDYCASVWTVLECFDELVYKLINWFCWNYTGGKFRQCKSFFINRLISQDCSDCKRSFFVLSSEWTV